MLLYLDIQVEKCRRNIFVPSFISSTSAVSLGSDGVCRKNHVAAANACLLFHRLFLPFVISTMRSVFFSCLCCFCSPRTYTRIVLVRHNQMLGDTLLQGIH